MLIHKLSSSCLIFRERVKLEQQSHDGALELSESIPRCSWRPPQRITDMHPSPKTLLHASAAMSCEYWPASCPAVPGARKLKVLSDKRPGISYQTSK